jgi:hypothetical protein
MTTDELPVLPMAAVVGENAKRLRGEHSGAALAKAVTSAGLRWGTARVAELEAARVSPTLPMLLVLCRALSELTGQPIKLADLFAGDTRVEITDRLHVPLAEVRAALSGAPVTMATPEKTAGELLLVDYIEKRRPTDWSAIPARRMALLYRIWNACGEVERRAAYALHIDMGQLVEVMADLWGHTLTEERDAIAGPDASAQRRGIVSRQLREDLRKAIETDGNH